MADALIVTSCLATTQGVLTLYLLPVVALFFIVAGIFFKLGFLGVFGSIILMVFSWYIAPCSGIFAFIVGALSLVLLIYFAAVAGFGFKNETFAGE